MQQRNPYEPPLTDLLDRKPPLHPSAPTDELEYAGIWQRLFAYLIDAFLFMPVSGIAYFLADQSRLFYLYWFVPGLVLGLLFHVYLVRRFGGTPGKLALKIRIALVDGSPVTTMAAMSRYAVRCTLSSLMSIAIILSSLSMSDELYFSLGYIERTKKLVELGPSWYWAVFILSQIWTWSGVTTMLFNKRHRAVHDYIARTVVIRSMPDT